MPKESSSIIVQLLGAGEMPLGIGLAHLFELYSRKGALIDWLPLEPTVVRVIPMMLAAKSRHPNAAKLLYDFLVGIEGQQIINAFNRPTMRRDVLPDPPRLIQGYKRVTMYQSFTATLRRLREFSMKCSACAESEGIEFGIAWILACGLSNSSSYRRTPVSRF